MTTTKLHQILYNAKVKNLCVFMLLCVHLVMGDVPGPCRHSLTKDHLLHIKSLINNQLQSGCYITFTFIERGSLSKVCYVKAALPWALELLSTHFHYVSSSENGQNVRALKSLILNIYSQQCAPVINEEEEEDPVTFERVYYGSPKEALLRVEEVLALYLDIITQSSSSVDWSCETEFAQQEHLPAFAYSPPSTEEPALGQLEKNSRDETSKDLHSLYKFGFIAMTVCCGLLLPITVCCFIKQKVSRQNFRVIFTEPRSWHMKGSTHFHSTALNCRICQGHDNYMHEFPARPSTWRSSRKEFFSCFLTDYFEDWGTCQH